MTAAVIYLVINIDFDPLENDIVKARVKRIAGYTSTRKEAERFIASKGPADFRAWDREMYPQWKIVEVGPVGEHVTSESAHLAWL